MKKTTLFATTLLALAAYMFAGTNHVKADTCTSQYGQYGSCTTTQSILVDKMVSTPTSTGSATQVSYVDNLSASDARYNPGAAVYFRIKVKNTSNTTLTNVTVKDYMPSYIEPIEGAGSFDSNTRILTINAGDFAANEEKTYYVKAQIFPQNQLPSNQGIICLVNKVNASNGTISDEDTAQFCVEKQVLGTPAVPATGPEFGFVIVGLELAALGAGIYLKKRS